MRTPAHNHLRRYLSVFAALAGAALLAGCSSTRTSLRNLNQDIPAEIVQQFRESQKPEIEKSDSFFLPLLSSSKAHITKTGSGFQSYREEDTVLGLLTDVKENARYNADGALLEYHYDGDFITGLLHGHQVSKTREGNGYRYIKKWSTLWGLISHKDQSVKSDSTL